MAFFRVFQNLAHLRAGGKPARPPGRRSHRPAAEVLEDRLALAADFAALAAAGPLAPPPFAIEDAATTPRDTTVDIDVLANDESSPAGLALSVLSVTEPQFGTASITSESIDSGLNPTGANQPPLIFSEIKPGEYIEFFNTTGTAIDLGTVPHWLCSPTLYVSVASLGSGVTLPADGYAQIPWPGTFSDSNAGGEVILYRSNADFGDGSLIEDFVAWGTNPHDTRLSLAESVGKWSGPPAAALAQGSIQRLAETSGTVAASYDTASAPTPGAGPAGTIQLVDKIRYVPAAGFTGADVFTYTVEDENGETETARVRVDVLTDDVERSLELANVTQAAGRFVSLPINLNDATGVIQIDMQLQYNTTFIDLTNASIRTGDLTAGWSVAANVDDAAGTVSFTLSSLEPLDAGMGSVAVLDVFIEEFASAGSSVDLLVQSAELNGGLLPADSTDGRVSVTARTFIVETTNVGANTITMALNDELNSEFLNLYDGQDAAVDAADIRLVGTASGEIAGSVHWDLARRELHFVKTRGVFAADDYTITLMSRAEGILNFNGDLLDGNDDGVAGGDFVHAFTVIETGSRLLSLPHVVRGPGQDVALAGTSAIPLALNEGSTVTSIDFVLLFDPEVFELDDVTLTAAVPSDWTLTIDSIAGAGVAAILAEGDTPLSAGAIVPLLIHGGAPTTATRGATGLLEIFDPLVNGGSLAAASQNGFQSTAFFGDATGDGSYSALDASYVARIGVRLENGLDAYPTTDPHLIGDITGDGTISSLDAAMIARKAVGLSQQQIPPLPPPAALAAPPAFGPPPTATADGMIDNWTLGVLPSQQTDSNAQPTTESENPETPSETTASAGTAPATSERTTASELEPWAGSFEEQPSESDDGENADLAAFFADFDDFSPDDFQD